MSELSNFGSNISIEHMTVQSEIVRRIAKANQFRQQASTIQFDTDVGTLSHSGKIEAGQNKLLWVTATKPGCFLYGHGFLMAIALLVRSWVR